MSVTWPTPAQTTHTVEAALQRATATIGVATGLVATGRPVDLAGLDLIAGTLCAQILDLPPTIGAGFRPALTDIQTRLGALAAAMRHSIAGTHQ